MSDWVENWKQKPYSLADLAKDAATILDTLRIRETHLVGLSLGGMVAQEFAINIPDRTLTLTSIMSSGNIADKELPTVSKRIAFDALKIGIKYGILKGEENAIKLVLALKVVVRGDAHYDLDVKGTAEQVLYNLRERNGYNPSASSQHGAVANRSVPRYDQLENLEVPMLIIHGVKDPLVPIEHSKKLADVIPYAKTIWFNNMGHDLPPTLIDSISTAIIQHIEEN